MDLVTSSIKRSFRCLYMRKGVSKLLINNVFYNHVRFTTALSFRVLVKDSYLLYTEENTNTHCTSCHHPISISATIISIIFTYSLLRFSSSLNTKVTQIFKKVYANIDQLG